MLEEDLQNKLVSRPCW